MHPLVETGLADAGQILERIGRQPSRLGIWTGHYNPHQFGLLLAVEHRRPSIAPAIREAFDAVLVVAQHPVSQRLAIHAG